MLSMLSTTLEINHSVDTLLDASGSTVTTVLVFSILAPSLHTVICFHPVGSINRYVYYDMLPSTLSTTQVILHSVHTPTDAFDSTVTTLLVCFLLPLSLDNATSALSPIATPRANAISLNPHAVQTNGLEACCLEGWPTPRFCVHALACVCLYSLLFFSLHSLVAAVSGIILDDGATTMQCYPAVICIFLDWHMILPACLRLVFRHALLLLFTTNILDYDKRIVDS